MRVDLQFLESSTEWMLDMRQNDLASYLSLAVKELKLLREMELTVTRYCAQSGRDRAWVSIDTLRATVARIRKEIET